MNRVQWNSHHGPAINVKDHTLYSAQIVGYASGNDLPEDEAQAIWDDTAQTFWDRAEELAKGYGYSGVYSEGRSGGWLVPHYANDRTLHSWADWLTSDDPEYVAEVAKFEQFGAAVVDLLDACIEDLRAELQSAVEEQAGKAALLEQGTPIRWTR